MLNWLLLFIFLNLEIPNAGMNQSDSIENEFLRTLTDIISANISDENFGVSELAGEAGMSRSSLLRKVKSLTKASVSQFIRQVRLKKAMDILRQTSFTVSEVSYQVGFSSTSYFIKCFREYYGYPPGEVGSRNSTETPAERSGWKRGRRVAVLSGIALGVLITAAVLFIVARSISSGNRNLEKTIAVLPFRNESSDTANIYIINGLMESILTNLQTIKDLRVASRTSVEKYRNVKKLISEIASELNVNYLVEGSGQKIGDEILLNIQLIEGPTDKHLWAKQYRRDTKDIFDLQINLAGDITQAIEVIITPEEKVRIEKPPTENLVAYDYFLRGLYLLRKGNRDELEEAIISFEKAIEYDNGFARAYADLAIAYYYLDATQAEKKYSELINSYADKALSFDDQLEQSLIAKAVYYLNTGRNDQAVPFLEKALKYNPNSAIAINSLSDFYARYSPDTEKYLEYALKGIRLDITSYDSVTASFIYLHISNAFIQSGFTNEAELYINKSLEFDPDNLYSQYVGAYIQYAKSRDLESTRNMLIEILEKDTTRLDVLQEVAKICYYMRDYEDAYAYYKRFTGIRESQNLDIYRAEDAKIGYVFAKMGMKEQSERYLREFKDYSDLDESVYKHINLALYYSFYGDTVNAIDQMRLFSNENTYHYWTIIFLKIDPLLDKVRDLPEFRETLGETEARFWMNHNKIKSALLNEKLL